MSPYRITADVVPTLGTLADYERLDEIAFDTDRKRMSVLCATPEGRVLYCKGAAPL